MSHQIDRAAVVPSWHTAAFYVFILLAVYEDIRVRMLIILLTVVDKSDIICLQT